MKREFLENLDLGGGAKLTKEAVEAIMAEHGKTKTGLENQIVSLTTERDTLQAQLGDASKEIQSYRDMDIDGIKTKAAEWEAKYNADTQALKDQLTAKEYEHTVSGAVAGMKFTSESAKKAFVADLTAKKLPVQEGKLLGLDDYVKTYRESDPGAFVPENDDKTPVAVKGGTGGQTVAADAALRAAMGLPTKTE